MATGVFLRLYRLDWQSLWVDEVHTIGPALTATSLADAYWNYINLAPTPPFYYLFIMEWTRWFGFSEYALRLPSALFGIATVAVLWFGMRRSHSREATAIATILMALSWPAIYYSQEVRAYSAVLFFMTWAAVAWMALVKDIGASRGSDWAHLTVAGLLATATHPFGFILVAFLYLYLFFLAVAARRYVVRTVLLGALPVLAYAAWLAGNLLGIQWALGGAMWERPDLRFFVDIGAFLFHHPVPALLTAIVPLGLGAAAYFGVLRRAVVARALDQPAVYLPFMLGVPFAFIFAVAQVQPFLYTRYLIVFLPFIYAFFAVVVTARRWRVPATPVLLVAALATSSLYWIVRDYYVVDKEQAREVSQFVRSIAGPSDVIVAGCQEGPPFECKVGPGSRTDADWSKYLYYLNYETLPELRIVPETFAGPIELRALLDRLEARGYDRLIALGSRAGRGYVLALADEMKARGKTCTETWFHQALAAVCRRQ